VSCINYVFNVEYAGYNLYPPGFSVTSADIISFLISILFYHSYVAKSLAWGRARTSAIAPRCRLGWACYVLTGESLGNAKPDMTQLSDRIKLKDTMRAPNVLVQRGC